MILFLLFACNEPDCSSEQVEPAEQHNVPQMHPSGEPEDTGDPQDTAYDTGGE